MSERGSITRKEMKLTLKRCPPHIVKLATFYSSTNIAPTLKCNGLYDVLHEWMQSCTITANPCSSETTFEQEESAKMKHYRLLRCFDTYLHVYDSMQKMF